MTGLFTHFLVQRTPTQADREQVIREGLVVLDANVLLSLYRYNDQARQDLLDVLGKLGDRLWVPHQVVKEFWGARLSVLFDRERRADRVCTDMERSFNQIRVQIEKWAPMVSLDTEQLQEMLALVHACKERVEQSVRKVAAVESERSSWIDTSDDPIVRALEKILEGRVGEPFAAEDEVTARKEASRRVAEQIPPGYRDAAKDSKKDTDGGDSAGDYFVWEQLLREASERELDVLFVTADVKEDWWRRRSELLLGPRAELVAELHGRSGKRLLMLQPHAFLATASQSFGVNLDPESVADVERADSTFEGPGWTKEGLKALLETLDIHAPTRARVIRRAAEQGGYVSRDEIYELGGYSESRQLTGWTRPLRTWTEHLRNEGVLGPEDGETDVLYAEYEGASRAKGFRVPQRVLEVLEQLDEG